MPPRTLAVAVLLSVAACGGASQEETQSRTPNPNVPREGIGAGGDMGSPARDMPSKGRGSEVSPRGKP
jgi:hypothetical protein